MSQQNVALAEKPVYPELEQAPPYAAPGQPMPGQPSPPAANPNTDPGAAIANVITVNQNQLGPYSTQTQCPQCRKTVMTETSSAAGIFMWIFVVVLLVFLWPLVFPCLIPFCVPSCKDVEHRCPECKFIIGKYQRHRGI